MSTCRRGRADTKISKNGNAGADCAAPPQQVVVAKAHPVDVQLNQVTLDPKHRLQNTLDVAHSQMRVTHECVDDTCARHRQVHVHGQRPLSLCGAGRCARKPLRYWVASKHCKAVPVLALGWSVAALQKNQPTIDSGNKTRRYMYLCLRRF